MTARFPEVAGIPTPLDEAAHGKRFAFGANWARFLASLTPTRIRQAEISLQRLLGDLPLDGKTFLDVGSGSGLFSLAARRLGARVYSFDYDPLSVACTRSLRDQHGAVAEWQVEQASVLDREHMQALGTFDVVYSWGVLHHTGAMWEALANTIGAVAPDGFLAIALYNRQPGLTPMWRGIKRLYQVLPGVVRPVLVMPFFLYFAALGLVSDVAAGRPPLQRWRGARQRGMSMYWDTVDWIGGWPFEVASPGEVVAFCRARGMLLERITTVGGRHGCNEFVFRRGGSAPPGPGGAEQRTGPRE